MFNLKSVFDLEKKSVFLINFFLVILVIVIFLFNLPIKYFFYFNIIFTLIISYFFFKRSRNLAKVLILTNLFIFFYFLYPVIALFLYEIFGLQSYIYVVFYGILLSYIFLYISGHNKDFLGNMKKFSFKLSFGVLLFGIFFGFLFFLINEPIPGVITSVFLDGNFFGIVMFIFFISLIIGLSEQLIFSGFLFNSYRKLTSKIDAYFQVAIIFVLFHILRFEVLVKHYYFHFNEFYLLFIILYYVFLFLFMVSALYLYSFKGKKYEGNFIYPWILHFAADFGLLMFYLVVAL